MGKMKSLYYDKQQEIEGLFNQIRDLKEEQILKPLNLSLPGMIAALYVEIFEIALEIADDTTCSVVEILLKEYGVRVA